MLEIELKKMWRDLFQDEWEYIEWYFQNIYKEKTTRVQLENEKPIGMLFENS